MLCHSLFQMFIRFAESQVLSDDDNEVYLKLYILLYADDTIIMAGSECEFIIERCTSSLYFVEVGNTKKTKVAIFSIVKNRNIPKFNYNGLPLTVVSDYRYLSIDIKLYTAIYSILRKSEDLYLPIDV